MRRNILLVPAVIILSSLLAIPFAKIIVYKTVFGYYGSLFVTEDVAHFANGFPFVYLILITLLFNMFGRGRKLIWVSILTLPIIMSFLYIQADASMWLWALIFFVSGLVLSSLLKFVASKLRSSGPSVVVK